MVRRREESYRDPLVLGTVTLMEALNVRNHNPVKLHISFSCEMHIFKYGSFAGYPNLQYLRIEQGYLLKLPKYLDKNILFFHVPGAMVSIDASLGKLWDIYMEKPEIS